jgi:hypothetical protein
VPEAGLEAPALGRLDHRDEGEDTPASAATGLVAAVVGPARREGVITPLGAGDPRQVVVAAFATQEHSVLDDDDGCCSPPPGFPVPAYRAVGTASPVPTAQGACADSPPPTGRIGDRDAPGDDDDAAALGGRIAGFAQRVLKEAATPLLPTPATPLLRTKVFDPSSGLPLRSTRIAAQPLANVPVARRGEALVIERLRRLEGKTTAEAKQDYEAMFGDDSVGADVEALRELFPDRARPRQSRGRRGARA